jgi:hypothetical protein
VADAASLKDESTDQIDAQVSWCCVFCQSDEEYSRLTIAGEGQGVLAQETHNGPVFVMPPLPTPSGSLRVFKIRQPDPTRPERGDADFASTDYEAFKAGCLGLPGFKLIRKPEFEMIELMAPGRDVRVYFSNPPVEEHSGIREALASTGF